MAKTLTLYNDGSALSPTFTTHTGSPSASGGNLVLAAGDGIKTVATDWDLTASSLRIKIVSPASVEGLFLVFDQGATVKPALNLHWNGWRAGLINGAVSISNYGNNAISSAQVAYGHIWETGGNVHFGHSTDGVTITDFYNTSFTTPSACTIYLLSGTVTVSVDEVGTASASSVAFRPYYITG